MAEPSLRGAEHGRLHASRAASRASEVVSVAWHHWHEIAPLLLPRRTMARAGHISVPQGSTNRAPKCTALALISGVVI